MDTASRAGYGFSFGSTAAGDYMNVISAQSAPGSNNTLTSVLMVS